MVDDSGLKRKLRQLLPAIEASVKPVMDRYATQMVAEMKVLVPKDTGALRDSIGWT